MAAELNLSRVDFIKVDIEGVERRAIAGASNLIARSRRRRAGSLPSARRPVVISERVNKSNREYRMECLCMDFDGVRPKIGYSY
jgi:hypothetical protein